MNERKSEKFKDAGTILGADRSFFMAAGVMRAKIQS